MELFFKGGVMMWPLLLTSIVALTVVIERLVFMISERQRRNPDAVADILAKVEHGQLQAAMASGKLAKDFVARTLVYALEHREHSFANALLLASNQELKRFSRGISTLDTIITMAPLLGLLGTVTGMISAFGILGKGQLDSPTVITGGIAEALIATAFGLFIAIMALIPFNYLNSRLEEARQEIENAATYLELLMIKGLGK